MFRKYKIQLGWAIAISLAIPSLLFITGCGPSEEYKSIKKELEQFPKVVERNAEVGKIRFLPREQQRGRDLRFEADLLDKDGNVIGKAGGFRVEGFGTRIVHVRYNDEPEPPPLEQVLAQHPDIVRRNAKVGKIDFIERPRGRGKEPIFVADLLDKDGNIIGKVMGSHMDGVGTQVSRVRYFDEPDLLFGLQQNLQGAQQSDSQTSADEY